jgi:hypothetical protein
MDHESIGSETTGKLEDEVDALFKLPLAEFIGVPAASQTKRGGTRSDRSRRRPLEDR